MHRPFPHCISPMPHDPSRPPAGDLAPTSRTFISQRLRLHYMDWGNAAAPPLILLHGGRDHCRSWDWVARRLAPRWHVLAPDLRGHGDSEWSTGSTYMMAGFLYDLAQLVHQQGLAPVTLVAHSLGGNIAVRFSGLYPETVRQLVAIEGLGYTADSPRGRLTAAEKMQKWIDETRELAAHQPRRYQSLEEAVARMQEANKRLSEEQARHLTIYGLRQNEDGTFSWKFDPYVRPWAPYDMSRQDIESLWARITCPTLHIGGTESWHSNPEKDGRVTHFRNARVKWFEGAGHWVHHDRLEGFMEAIEGFLVQ